MKSRIVCPFTAVVSLIAVSSVWQLTAAGTYSGSGTTAASIQSTVDAFRADLGTLNPNTPGSLGSGRREINWDGVPQSVSGANLFPGDFFNGTTPGRARGIEFSTPGTGFSVSVNAGDGPVEFGDISPLYPTLFEPFSAQKLFAPLGSTITDVFFFLPGTTTQALTRGFGAVFSDVDVSDATGLIFFGADNSVLGTLYAPAASGDETFSFAGMTFPDPVVARVRIITGTEALSAANPSGDVVVMDDLIFGEPAAVPEFASTLGLMTGALLCLVPFRRRLA